MSRVQRDIEDALFGSPLGAVDMLVGIFSIVAAIVSFIATAFKKRGRRG